MKNLPNLCAHITYLKKKVVVEVKKPASKELQRNQKTENSIDLQNKEGGLKSFGDLDSL